MHILSCLSPMIMTGPVYTYGDPKNIVIFKTCKNPQAAWNYIKTLISDEGDLRLSGVNKSVTKKKKS